MLTISKIREKVRGLTPFEVGAEVLLRARRRTVCTISRLADRPDTSYVTDEKLQASLDGEPVDSVAAHIREGNRLHLTAGLNDLARTVELIKRLFPDSVDDAKSEADPILEHRISVFSRAFDFGPQIDWHADPATGARWPFNHHTRVPYKIGHAADVRAVWELNRLQHFTTLGRAYLLTGDESYTEEFLIQLASWYEENPPNFGVNWMVAMEAAIRAINIIAALEMFRASPNMTDQAIELILKLLLAHAQFIRSHLEFSYRTSSNHYLSNLTGLFAIGMVLPCFKESVGWVNYSAPRLLSEMGKQVTSDGVDYEGTIGYHRLVLEMFLTFFAMSRESRIELPVECWGRLESMFDFVRHYLKPDQTAPVIGDSDDGRLIRFKERPPVDHSYLMPIAAVLFENDIFKQSNRIDEEALWWFGEAGHDTFEGLEISEIGPVSQAFPNSQIYIQREGPLYAIIDCGDHGAGGRGSHAHSDALSFEVYAFDRTFLRDPGTFVYNASERWRNRFRSTAYHNTVQVDGRDISPIMPGHLFALGRNVRPQVYRWESTDEQDVLDAAHYGYTRLDEPVTHRRVMTFDKREGYWIIEDYFTGSGTHQFEFFFNFDYGLDVNLAPDLRITATGARAAMAIIPASQHGFEAKFATRWVSLNYGTRVRASGIIYRLYAGVPFENVTLIVPYRLGEEARVERIAGARGQGPGAGKI